MIIIFLNIYSYNKAARAVAGRISCPAHICSTQWRPSKDGNCWFFKPSCWWRTYKWTALYQCSLNLLFWAFSSSTETSEFGFKAEAEFFGSVAYPQHAELIHSFPFTYSDVYSCDSINGNQQLPPSSTQHAVLQFNRPTLLDVSCSSCCSLHCSHLPAR